MQNWRWLPDSKSTRIGDGGVARASITGFTARIKDLEREVGEARTLELAQRTSQRLLELDSEFRAHHHSLIDLIDDDESLGNEQDILDSHDDLVAELGVCVKQVIAASSSSSAESSRRITSRKLAHLEKSLTAIISIISDGTTPVLDTCLLRQYKEKTNNVNKDLVKTRDDLHRMDLEEGDELFTLQDSLKKQVFDCSVGMKKLLSPTSDRSDGPVTSPEGKGVKLCPN